MSQYGMQSQSNGHSQSTCLERGCDSKEEQITGTYNGNTRSPPPRTTTTECSLHRSNVTDDSNGTAVAIPSRHIPASRNDDEIVDSCVVVHSSHNGPDTTPITSHDDRRVSDARAMNSEGAHSNMTTRAISQV